MEDTEDLLEVVDHAQLARKLGDSVLFVTKKLKQINIPLLSDSQANDLELIAKKIKRYYYCIIFTTITLGIAFVSSLPTPILFAVLDKYKNLIGFANLSLAASVAIVASCVFVLSIVIFLMLDKRVTAKISNAVVSKQQSEQQYVDAPINDDINEPINQMSFQDEHLE
jgi:hypothetical protein